jgi:lysophospholipase L1-like esterase
VEEPVLSFWFLVSCLWFMVSGCLRKGRTDIIITYVQNKRLFFLSILLNLVLIAAGVFFYVKRYLYEKTLSERILKIENGKGPGLLYGEAYNHWMVKRSLYESMPVDSNDIVFFGNSLVAECDWAEFLHNPKVKNRGISGDYLQSALLRLPGVAKFHPVKIFIELGTNDASVNLPLAEFEKRYQLLIDTIKTISRKTEIFIFELLPKDDNLKSLRIKDYNRVVWKISKEKAVTFIPVFESFANDSGNLKEEFTYDGVHLTAKGYELWRQLLLPYL